MSSKPLNGHDRPPADRSRAIEEHVEPVDPLAQTMADTVVDALRWALEASTDPALAAANWLAHDINPRFESAIELLTDGPPDLDDLRRAKSAFKTMRILGETAADRRLGARLYLASIAAAMVHHKQRISRQSDAAMLRALNRLNADRQVPQPLQHLAGMAICAIQSGTPLKAPAPDDVRTDDADQPME